THRRRRLVAAPPGARGPRGSRSRDHYSPGSLLRDRGTGSAPQRRHSRRPRGPDLIVYFDSSALVKRYVEEAGSDSVRSLVEAGLPSTSRFSEVEIVSALARRCREGAFPAEERDRAIAQVREDFRTLSLVELTTAVVARAGALLIRHPLRAADSLQLASCLE